MRNRRHRSPVWARILCKITLEKELRVASVEWVSLGLYFFLNCIMNLDYILKILGRAKAVIQFIKVWFFFFSCSSGSIPKEVRREKCKKWYAALKFCSATQEHRVTTLLKVYLKKKKKEKSLRSSKHFYLIKVWYANEKSLPLSNKNNNRNFLSYSRQRGKLHCYHVTFIISSTQWDRYYYSFS